MQKNQEKQPRKRGTLETAICIFIAIVMMLATIPLAQMYCDSESYFVYLVFVGWLFGVVPIIFLYMERKRRKEENTEKIEMNSNPWSC